ncbi:glycosyltransferase involved in cell wall biosynthesis [Pullulanibacillus pueri]|uniref:Glycosyltransferase 2-like domain-containing protein n=1 Tax=Pullulanibacillus pueri TaxID=1437324 RepID=A0A8J3EM82_9BACL|nr:glycosyltransferase [Pullulanibacillus pueri]MBM7682441.1 glycosyltransferase involved in cell wall biosynthesis [Pullulanibacillus pueri]GGH81627.1 hypothetical protein GCM10007096_19800 [Pullulanibacillus pueri]
MKPIISIIVPIYNIENYIEKCINSILEQTFPHFELILINDGSTDHSGEICEEYAKKDIRVRVIHKENGGPASARNLGLDVAKGDYIGFVDGDDYIDKDMYELLYTLALKHDADVVECNLKIVKNGHIEIKEDQGKIEVGNNLFALKGLLEFPIRNSPVNKLYKRDLFNDLRYPDKLYEDGFLAYKVYYKLNKYVFIETGKYNYIKRKGSRMDKQETYSLRNLDGVESQEERYYFLKENIKDPYILKLAEFRFFKDIYNNYRGLQKNKHVDPDKIYRDDLRKKINKNYSGFFTNYRLSEFKFYVKISHYNIFIFDHLYKLYRIYFSTLLQVKRPMSKVKRRLRNSFTH